MKNATGQVKVLQSGHVHFAFRKKQDASEVSAQNLAM